MAIEASGPRIYETDVAKNRIVVIDRVARKVITTWPHYTWEDRGNIGVG